VAVAIVSDMTRGELAVSNLIRDKIRIAEDLDNVVMTNLGDIGTRLNGIRERVQDGISTKIRMAIADIEEVAAELSNAIDGLSNGALKTTPVLHRIVELLERESSELGFKPVLSVDGPLDNLVSPELRDAILHAIDQIILNIACHSMATWATVDIHADSLSLVISICDDGIGIPAGPASARWINRLAARAQQHGGEFSAMEKIPIGCLYEWRVPLPT